MKEHIPLMKEFIKNHSYDWFKPRDHHFNSPKFNWYSFFHHLHALNCYCHDINPNAVSPYFRNKMWLKYIRW